MALLTFLSLFLYLVVWAAVVSDLVQLLIGIFAIVIVGSYLFSPFWNPGNSWHELVVESELVVE